MVAPRAVPTLLLALFVWPAVSCAPVASGPGTQAYLFEKGQYQAVYAPDGRLLRLLQDADSDGVAELTVVYEPDGTRRVEIDGDHDGVIERWEVYGPGNRLLRVGQSRRTPGRADLWEVLGDGGVVRERELDENGDGKVDRRERFDARGLSAVELDTDGDGRSDRWQQWQAGRMLSEELDADGDGRPDRRLVYDAGGAVHLVKLRP